jgi:hypothetical protein
LVVSCCVVVTRCVCGRVVCGRAMHRLRCCMEGVSLLG